MMKTFTFSKNFYIAYLVVFVCQANAMEHTALSQQYSVPGLRRVAAHQLQPQAQQQQFAAYPQLVAPQSHQFPVFPEGAVSSDQYVALSQKFETLSRQYQELVKKKRADDLVTNAKFVAQQARGANAISLNYLNEARRDNPEAELLYSGDLQLASRKRLQRFRLKKAKEDIEELEKIRANDDANKDQLAATSSAYCRLQAIIKHPIFPESEDAAVRREAEFLLGKMCMEKLGIPIEEATLEKAREYLTLATQHGFPSAKTQLDYVEKMYRISNEPKTEPAPGPVVDSIAKAPAESVSKPAETQHPEKQQPQQTFATIAATKKVVREAQDNIHEAQLAQNQDAPQIESAPAQGSCTVSSKPQTHAEEVPPAVQEIKADDKKEPKKIKPKKDSQPKKPGQPKIKQPKQPKKIFEVTEDPSFADQQLMATEQSSDSAAATHTSHTQKKTAPKLSRSEKQAIAGFTKAQQQKAKKKSTTDSKEAPSQKDSVKEKQAKPKKEKKKEKRSEKAAIDTAAEQQKNEYKKAFSLVTSLIDAFLDKEQSGKIKGELFELSEKWEAKEGWKKTAVEVFKNSYNYLTGKCTNDDNPGLMGILLYLSCNKEDHKNRELAQQLISNNPSIDIDNQKDQIRNWYHALMLFETERTCPEHNQQIINLVDHVFQYQLAKWQQLKESLLYPKTFEQFICSFATKKDAPEMDRARPLFIKVLFGPNTMEKSTKDELMAECDKGSYAVTIFLTQLYKSGVYVNQSLMDAISIIQKSVEMDTKFDITRSNLLDEIGELVSKKHDLITYAYTSYLYNLEMAKQSGHEEIILTELNQIEQVVKKSSEPLQSKMAEVFHSSGACKTFIPLARKNRAIAQYLYDAACVRVNTFHHPEKWYSDIFELARTQELYWPTSLHKDLAEFTTALLAYYVGHSDAKKLKAEFSQTVNVTDTNAKIIKPFHDFLAEQFKKNNTPHPNLLAQLQYMQGNDPNGQPADRLMAAKGQYTLFLEWNEALLQFQTEAESPERNDAVINKLSKGLSAAAVNYYPSMKNLLIFDEQLLALIKDTAARCPENYVARVIVAKMTILFGEQVTALDNATALGYLKQAHENGYTDASYFLSQLYIWGGNIVKPSVKDAIDILQKATNLKPCSDKYLYAVLNAIRVSADHYPPAALSAIYLMLVHQTRENKAPDIVEKIIDSSFQAIENNLEESIAKFNELSADEKVQASHLLIDTGAYVALLSTAQEQFDQGNIELAMRLGDAAAACVHAGAPENDFKEALQLGAKAYTKNNENHDAKSHTRL